MVVKALRFAPPTTIRLASGPDGSSYRNQAEKYKAILARDGVKVEVLSTKGALDNLQQLANPKVKVDVGFVQGGLADIVDGDDKLVSLGSVFAQPLMVYCRTTEPVEILTQLARQADRDRTRGERRAGAGPQDPEGQRDGRAADGAARSERRRRGQGAAGGDDRRRVLDG